MLTMLQGLQTDRNLKVMNEVCKKVCYGDTMHLKIVFKIVEQLQE